MMYVNIYFFHSKLTNASVYSVSILNQINLKCISPTFNYTFQIEIDLHAAGLAC